ncbi:STAS domain-containing protein [Streptomyces sp. NPDC002054]|uniref:STAS domain-containing protein n=1 Tax=Streptomyces sp. NPDC002054 TaxID=3154663 RepID=UPI003320DECA
MSGNFSVVAMELNAGTVLALSGDLDRDTAAPLREALEAVLGGADAPATGRLLVDCGGLRFCDSTGLNLLLRARQTAEDSGGALELAALQQPVARMFEITGAGGVFTVHRDLAAAFAHGDGGGGTP